MKYKLMVYLLERWITVAEDNKKISNDDIYNIIEHIMKKYDILLLDYRLYKNNKQIKDGFMIDRNYAKELFISHD